MIRTPVVATVLTALLLVFSWPAAAAPTPELSCREWLRLAEKDRTGTFLGFAEGFHTGTSGQSDLQKRKIVGRMFALLLSPSAADILAMERVCAEAPDEGWVEALVRMRRAKLQISEPVADAVLVRLRGGKSPPIEDMPAVTRLPAKEQIRCKEWLELDHSARAQVLLGFNLGYRTALKVVEVLIRARELYDALFDAEIWRSPEYLSDIDRWCEEQQKIPFDRPAVKGMILLAAQRQKLSEREAAFAAYWLAGGSKPKAER